MTTSTKTHDSHHCSCEMCIWADKQEREQVDHALVESVIAHVATELRTPDFDEEWNRAPHWTKRTTERESAEYWVEVGRRMEREAGLKMQNEDLREMKRMIEGRGMRMEIE